MHVKDLMSHSIFEEFQLASGSSGLYNLVTGTGIFEWETLEDIEKNFLPGEFVITTLSQAKGDVNLAEAFLKRLILQGVSAIAIKSIYFMKISKEMNEFSVSHHVPIFFFSETYFDDIIYHIKNALINGAGVETEETRIKSLLRHDALPEDTARLAREINPFFNNHVMSCFLTWEEEGPFSLTELREFNARKAKDENSENRVYSILSYGRGLVVIYTVKKPSQDMTGECKAFVQELSSVKGSCSIGISSLHHGNDNLDKAVKEAVYAHATSILDHKPCLEFAATGLDRMLMPNLNDPWVSRYHEELISKIASQDEANNSNLMETLLAYVECDGDIRLTGQKLFQHGNTIRYRLEKINKILHIEGSMEGFSQMYALVRIHRMREIMKPWE